MTYAAIYDIHGNLPALDAVLADVRSAGIDAIVVGGDVIPGPMPRESLDRLLELDLPVRFIRGNGERVVLAEMHGIESEEVPPPFREGIRWTARQLDARHEAAIASWPDHLELTIGSLGTVLFCHATPRNDTEIFTRNTAESRLLPVFGSVSADIVVCGHTHMQLDRVVGDVRVVNAGSVGMPFGEPGAYWLELGAELRLRRTQYDLAAAAERIRRTTYPQAEEFARRNVLQPPSEQEILAAYANAELR
ncbi:MAG TPA: metallophosphoesterase family protein [Gemmatimonadaceae bacterium]|nr:metallophosphoesterase family protein [Gemmatimonadaceae bacterium]